MRKLQHDCTSDLDRWFDEYHKTQPKTESEQAEIDKHQNIQAKRDHQKLAAPGYKDKK